MITGRSGRKKGGEGICRDFHMFIRRPPPRKWHMVVIGDGKGMLGKPHRRLVAGGRSRSVAAVREGAHRARARDTIRRVARDLCGNQNSRRVRPESSRRPPRHRRAACSIAWRCRFLTARAHPTHCLICTQASSSTTPSSARSRLFMEGPWMIN